MRAAVTGGFAAALAPIACRALSGRQGPFAPPLGVTRGTDHAEVALAAGLDFLEVKVAGDLVPHEDDAAFAPHKAALLASAVPPRAANHFLAGSLRCTGPEADHDAVVEWCRVAFPRAESVGIDVVTFGSSGARSIPDGWSVADGEEQLVELLVRLAPLAADHGVAIGLEPLQVSECNILNRLSDCDRVARAVGHPGVGLTADVFHMLRADEGPEAITAASAAVVHVHLAEKGERTAPGVDGDDFTGYLAALRDTGFSGRISLECRWGDLARELAPAVDALREQVATVG